MAMQELMLADLPVHERAQVLRDSCDQIQERHYTRRFTQEERDERSKEMVELSIQKSEHEDEIRAIKAEYKARIKPVEEELKTILAELKAGGEFIKGECFKIIDHDLQMVGIYSPEGVLLEERTMRPDEKQRSIFQVKKTGTFD
jgi:vacuolar-type H+-ATPase subunit I/STV1